MIDIRELRIGNIVQPTNDIQTEAPGPVDTEWWCIIHEQEKELKPGEEMEWEIDVEPVPITEEWLERCGFRLTSSYHPEGPNYNLAMHGYEIDVCPGYNMIDISNSPGRSIRKMNIKHIHQLQNLLYAITGEELKIK